MPENNKTILIVENDQVLSRMLLHALSAEGFTAIEARNGVEGLQAVHTYHPALILLDLDMPQMNGIAMLKELRKDEENQGIKVIILTNLNTPDQIAEATEEEIYDYLVKSDWELDEIILHIKEKLAT